MPYSFRYTVTGRVQGVFFRAFTQRTARELGVRGYVRNDPNGDVSGIAQGDKDALSKFQDAISKGPRHAKVSGVELSEERDVNEYEYAVFEVWT